MLRSTRTTTRLSETNGNALVAGNHMSTAYGYVGPLG